MKISTYSALTDLQTLFLRLFSASIGGATAAFTAEYVQPTLNGVKFDLSTMQTVDLEDGSILYLPKNADINLEETQNDPNVKIVAYDTSPDVSSQGNIIQLTDCDMEQNPKNVVNTNLDSLISVSHQDEQKFTPNEWNDILEKIECGEIVWED